MRFPWTFLYVLHRPVPHFTVRLHHQCTYPSCLTMRSTSSSSSSLFHLYFHFTLGLFIRYAWSLLTGVWCFSWCVHTKVSRHGTGSSVLVAFSGFKDKAILVGDFLPRPRHGLVPQRVSILVSRRCFSVVRQQVIILLDFNVETIIKRSVMQFTLLYDVEYRNSFD